MIVYTFCILKLRRLWQKNDALDASLGYLAKEPVSKIRELQAKETAQRSKAMAALPEDTD